jgi:hypothetical protein
VVVTHELRIDATGTEGSLHVVLGCDSEIAERDSHGAQRKLAEAYRHFFETDEEPAVAVLVSPAVLAA